MRKEEKLQKKRCGGADVGICKSVSIGLAEEAAGGEAKGKWDGEKCGRRCDRECAGRKKWEAKEREGEELEKNKRGEEGRRVKPKGLTSN